MQIFASEIVAGAKDIELDLFRSAEERRIFLIEFFNENTEFGCFGYKVDPLPDGASDAQAAMMIEEVLGRPVVLSEVYL